MINLINDTISKEGVNDLVSWLKTYPRLTKGSLTPQFEDEIAAWLGSKYAVFVNSGSSANLIMLYALIVKRLLKNNKVVVPALCWITDIAPVIQFGLDPILCDCNLDNLSVDLDYLESLFITEKPAVLLLVSILGFSPDMDRIQALCKQHDVILLEDNCESLGTVYKGKKLGTFGLMSTTSLYFGHIISTIEGGVVFTDNKEMYNLLLALRSHGWNRDWSTEDRAAIEKECNVLGINALYTFYYPGFNVRSTDLQAFIGINQLKKLDNIIAARNKNYNLYFDNLKCGWKPKEVEGSYTANFAFPIISYLKNEIADALRHNEIESRPLVCGSMGTQPFYKDLYGELHLENCGIVDKEGIYIPNHPGLTHEDIMRICNIINTVCQQEK